MLFSSTINGIHQERSQSAYIAFFYTILIVFLSSNNLLRDRTMPRMTNIGIISRRAAIVSISTLTCISRAFSEVIKQSRIKSPCFVYSDLYSCDWPSEHRFPMSKFRDLKNYLSSSGLYTGEFITPPEMTERPDYMEAAYNVHEEGYLDRFISECLSPAEKRKIGLAFNEHLVRRTFAEAAGTCYTAELALSNGLAANLAGGTHHANRTGGSGFTVINDLAIAAHWLLSRHLCKRIMV
jgi:hypothetical protein